MTTPKADGLRMPAEWEAHGQCWMAWPNSNERWGTRLDAAAEAYGSVAKAIAAFEPVTVVTGPARAADVSLRCGRGVSVLSAETVDSHLRDYGPTFVIDSQAGVAGIDWRFDGTEGRAERFDKDAAIARTLLDTLKMRRYASALALEGGAIQTDGEGTVLVTESSLLDRNPDLDRAQIEQRLGADLGAEKVIWLAGGLTGDPAGGLVDLVAGFARPGVVLALTAAATGGADTAVLEENLARLRDATDSRDRRLEVIEIRQPSPIEQDGAPAPASYVSVYLANGAVIAPQFEDARDSQALARLKEAFPDRKIVPIDVIDIAEVGGIHAIALAQPTGTPLPPI